MLTCYLLVLHIGFPGGLFLIFCSGFTLAWVFEFCVVWCLDMLRGLLFAFDWLITTANWFCRICFLGFLWLWVLAEIWVWLDFGFLLGVLGYVFDVLSLFSSFLFCLF